MSKSLKAIIGIVLIFVIGFSLYKTITFSSDVLKEEEAENLKRTESFRNEKAEGASLFDYEIFSIDHDEDLKKTIESHDVTVVNLFASWCNPCRNEAPDLNEFYLKEKSHDVALVGLNVQDNVKSRDAFLDEFNIEYPIYTMNDDKDFMTELQLIIIPTTLFVNSDGEIIRTYVGEISKKTMHSYVDYVKGE